MAAIDDLIGKIENPELRAEMRAAVDALASRRKFGLVFEDHLPESTPLPDLPVRRGAKVARRDDPAGERLVVLQVADGVAACAGTANATSAIPVADLVCVADGDFMELDVHVLDLSCFR